MTDKIDYLGAVRREYQESCDRVKEVLEIDLLYCPICKHWWWDEGETVCPDDDCGGDLVRKNMVERKWIMKVA